MHTDSILLFIHPPLAILAYIFVAVLLIMSIRYRPTKGYRQVMEKIGLLAWSLTLAGLITGMIWAQIAWGSYWSWDPKETSTFFLFLIQSCFMAAFYMRRGRTALIVLSAEGVLMILLTLIVPLIMESLH